MPAQKALPAPVIIATRSLPDSKSSKRAHEFGDHRRRNRVTFFGRLSVISARLAVGDRFELNGADKEGIALVVGVAVANFGRLREHRRKRGKLEARFDSMFL